ncbi:hypothetical protein [Thalassobius sp. Cn5-15]|uniref:hypothetical protein n=1 Tax=Thalassobius sp. Cn5-15 TaxID=2917763 RepID=UPI001EF1A4B7|nr:hypothetical protein [Thalassobius sp. Cn5-15]MCG7492434.1 hypothetical protein [Thalassobius sp. Cn5-15]
MTALHLVEWRMHIDADSPQEAAQKAWSYMRRQGSTANVFDVYSDGGNVERVDLQALIEDEQTEPSQEEIKLEN